MRTLAILGASGLALTVGLGELLSTTAPAPVREVALGLEISKTAFSRDSGCAEVESIVADLLDDPRPMVLAVLVSGDHSTGYAPRRLGSIEFDPVVRALEGRELEVEKVDAVLQRVRQLCTRIEPADVSAVLDLIDGTIEHLSGRSCHLDHVECRAIIRTDGLGNVRRRLKRRLRGAKGTSTDEKITIPTHVSVTLCGLGSRRAVSRRQRLPAVTTVEAALLAELQPREAVVIRRACVF